METLDKIDLNTTAIIKSLNFNDKIQRRFLDLGIIPGTPITPVYSSIFNDPIAYEVRGSLISIRNDDSQKINVEIRK